MPSNRIVWLQRSSAQVSTTARDLAPKLAERLRPILEAGLAPGETLPDLALVVRLFGRALEREVASLVATDAGLDTGRRLEAAHRARRDERLSDLRTCLVEIRKTARGIFGEFEGDALLRIQGRIAREPIKLLRQAHDAVAALEKPSAAQRRYAPRSGSAADPARWAEDLRAAIAPLEAAQHEVVSAGGDRVGRWAENQETYAAHRVSVSRVAGILESLLEAAEMPAAAHGVRLRRRRRSG